MLSQVSIMSESFDIPQLNRERRIWVYLPPNYNNTKKKYPVIYMNDAQNLFDLETSFAGEWEVDETLNKIYQEKKKGFIVIGIEHGKTKRLDEYSPWTNEKYGGGEGSDYADFIIKTLKPFIDNKYRTLSTKENTAIFGSSMGGLISFYATLKYPEIFGKAGVFSPSFWFSNQSFEYAKKYGNLKNNKIYFLAGDKEGVNNTSFKEISQTAIDLNKINSLLIQNGFTESNLFTKIVPNGLHNEKMWRENFEEAILWLFNDSQ